MTGRLVTSAYKIRGVRSTRRLTCYPNVTIGNFRGSASRQFLMVSDESVAAGTRGWQGEAECGKETNTRFFFSEFRLTHPYLPNSVVFFFESRKIHT